MYLDTDPILAELKDEDWLASDVDIESMDDPKTSVATSIEIQYALEDVWDRRRLVRVHEELEGMEIRLLPLNVEMIDHAATLREGYPRLNLFDGVHLGTAQSIDEPIVSTDSLYPEIEEIDHVDPRDL